MAVTVRADPTPRHVAAWSTLAETFAGSRLLPPPTRSFHTPATEFLNQATNPTLNDLSFRVMLGISAAVAGALVVLVGVVLGERSAALGLSGLAILLGAVHAAMFTHQFAGRTAPAELHGWPRRIFLLALIAILAVVIGNAVLISLYLDRVISTARAIPSYLVLVLLGILVARTWRVPSARRAATIHLAAMFLGIPVVFGMYGLYRIAGAEILAGATFVTCFVMLAAGTVLERVFGSARDSDPSTIPSATVHRDLRP